MASKLEALEKEHERREQERAYLAAVLQEDKERGEEANTRMSQLQQALSSAEAAREAAHEQAHHTTPHHTTPHHTTPISQHSALFTIDPFNPSSAHVSGLTVGNVCALTGVGAADPRRDRAKRVRERT